MSDLEALRDKLDPGNPIVEKRPLVAAALSGARSLAWTEERCAGCGRPAYTRRDGRSYLYRYSADGPAVCRLRCAEEAAHA